MFDFERLSVYTKAKKFNIFILRLLKEKKINIIDYRQLRRASLSIMLNIAEGTGRYTKADKRRFYVIARGSVFECVALFEYMTEEGVLDKNEYEELYKMCEEVSMMLHGLIAK